MVDCSLEAIWDERPLVNTMAEAVSSHGQSGAKDLAKTLKDGQE